MKVLLLAIVLVVGCKKDDEPAPKGPPPISEAERKRGEQACTAYVARLCECAKAKPALAEKCDLQKDRPKALQLALEAAASPDTEARDIFLSQDAARDVIAKCIEDNAKLDAEGCP